MLLPKTHAIPRPLIMSEFFEICDGLLKKNYRRNERLHKPYEL